jgi:hypothetical protein
MTVVWEKRTVWALGWLKTYEFFNKIKGGLIKKLIILSMTFKPNIV